MPMTCPEVHETIRAASRKTMAAEVHRRIQAHFAKEHPQPDTGCRVGDDIIAPPNFPAGQRQPQWHWTTLVGEPNADGSRSGIGHFIWYLIVAEMNC